MLRSGDPRALDAYEAHGRIVAGTLDEHLNHLAAAWIDDHQHGRSVALVASTNDHVDLINHSVQTLPTPPRRHRPDPGDTDRRGREGARRRRHRDPPQRPPPRHHHRRAGAQPRDLDSHRRPHRRLDHRVPPRWTRHRGAARGVRPRTRPARLRRHRARLAIRHRRAPRTPSPQPRRLDEASTSLQPAAPTRTSSSSSPRATTSPRRATYSKASSLSIEPTYRPSLSAERCRSSYTAASTGSRCRRSHDARSPPGSHSSSTTRGATSPTPRAREAAVGGQASPTRRRGRSGRARVRQGRSRDRASSPRHRRGSRRRHRSPTSRRRHPTPVAYRTASTTPIVAPRRGSRGHSSAARRGASEAG